VFIIQVREIVFLSDHAPEKDSHYNSAGSPHSYRPGTNPDL
jgi:hypothetical protein